MRSAAALLLLALSLPVAARDAAPACLPEAGFAAAAERHLPAVAELLVLRSRARLETLAGDPMDPPDLPPDERPPSRRSFASGFFIDGGGHLLASSHSVSDAAAIWVHTSGGQRVRAQVLGVDRRHDVALLAADVRGTPAIALGQAAPVRAGQWVFALGAPFGLRHTVTAGVVSAYPRFLHGSGTAFIQTDAALNPGSSGGPVFDAQGRLVGMGTMVLSDTGVYAGVSLVLPAAELARIARRLLGGQPDAEAALGVLLQPLEEGLDRAFGVEPGVGALLARVTAGSGAARAGLLAGDVLLGLREGERLGYEALRTRIATLPAGSAAQLQVWRSGRLHTVMLSPSVAVPADAPPPRTALVPLPESRLGLVLADASGSRAAQPGLRVDAADGSALLAGIEPGDRVLAVNGTPVSTLREFDAALQPLASKAVVALLLWRDGSVSYVPVWPER